MKIDIFQQFYNNYPEHDGAFVGWSPVNIGIRGVPSADKVFDHLGSSRLGDIERKRYIYLPLKKFSQVYLLGTCNKDGEYVMFTGANGIYLVTKTDDQFIVKYYDREVIKTIGIQSLSSPYELSAAGIVPDEVFTFTSDEIEKNYGIEKAVSSKLEHGKRM